MMGEIDSKAKLANLKYKGDSLTAPEWLVVVLTILLGTSIVTWLVNWAVNQLKDL